MLACVALTLLQLAGSQRALLLDGARPLVLGLERGIEQPGRARRHVAVVRVPVQEPRVATAAKVQAAGDDDVAAVAAHVKPLAQLAGAVADVRFGRRLEEEVAPVMRPTGLNAPGRSAAAPCCPQVRRGWPCRRRRRRRAPEGRR